MMFIVHFACAQRSTAKAPKPRYAPSWRQPSNLKDATKLKTWTQELRLASSDKGPFQWVIGGFYSKAKAATPAIPKPSTATKFVAAAYLPPSASHALATG